jgi:hypothetical protein
MSDLMYSSFAHNYRKAQGFSNFESRNVVFYTVYLAPKNPGFLADYQADPQVPNSEFAQVLQTIAFAGVELFFIGEPSDQFPTGPGPEIAFVIGVNSDTSNMGDVEIDPDVYAAEGLGSALGNAGWMNMIVRMNVGHNAIYAPL